MLTVLGIWILLVLGGLRGGSTASQVQIYRKSVHAGHILGSSHDGRLMNRGKLHTARSGRKNSVHRSLDLEGFNIRIAPTVGKLNLPTILKLYPPTTKPLHLSANIPLRFGRNNRSSLDQPSSSNLPLRFGRDNDPGGNLPLRFGRDNNSAPNIPLRFGRDSEQGNSDTTAQMFERWLQGCPQCSAEKVLQGLFLNLLRKFTLTEPH